MRKDLKVRFWQDFYIPTQEETTDVSFANPADVARSLVKARNWYGTIVQEMIDINKNIAEKRRQIKQADDWLFENEVVILSRIPKLSVSSVKTKEIRESKIIANATEEEIQSIENYRAYKYQQEDELATSLTERDNLELMRKAVEKTQDWLSQYINWHKFELRELN